jgi:tRNA (guanine-N7-)-methyltransferase
MRRKKLYRKLVHEFPEQIYSPGSHEEVFRDWIDRLRGGREIVLEVGTGAGDFLTYQAKQHPEYFFLGVEVKTDRTYRAYRKAQSEGVHNIAFLQTEANRLLEFDFPPVKTIYLLFSDPWPKKRHIIRRLTSEQYLPLYEKMLIPSGELIMKTDNQKLFEYSLESLKIHHWNIVEQDHQFKTPSEEQTAYEKRFLAESKPIYYLKARHPQGKD